MPFGNADRGYPNKELEPLTSKPSLAILIRCPILYQTRKPLRQPAVKWAFTTAVKLWFMILKEFIQPGRGGFKVMGHEKVWVLDGGLPAWIKVMLLKKDRNNCMKR
jgi:hypothetical protein